MESLFFAGSNLIDAVQIACTTVNDVVETSMRAKMKASIIIMILGVVAIVLTGCNRYAAKPIEGWIIDTDTKTPIEGVIVVANWQLHKSTIGGKIPGAHLNIMETITDKIGRFFFEGWGPRTAFWGFFIDRDPALLFFKEGYGFLSLKYLERSETDNGNVRQSDWNGKRIELKRFDGNLNDYAIHLSSLYASMRTILHGDRCEWKTTPNLVLAIAK